MAACAPALRGAAAELGLVVTLALPRHGVCLGALPVLGHALGAQPSAHRSTSEEHWVLPAVPLCVDRSAWGPCIRYLYRVAFRLVTFCG